MKKHLNTFAAAFLGAIFALVAVAVDTARSNADILALMPDNTAGAISAQDLRDFAESVPFLDGSHGDDLTMAAGFGLVHDVDGVAIVATDCDAAAELGKVVSYDDGTDYGICACFRDGVSGYAWVSFGPAGHTCP